MIKPAWFVDQLADLGVNFFTGVPDSLLKSLNAHLLRALPQQRHVIAANEGAAAGIAIGHYLCTGRPAVVYLQNSGFGHLANPLLSLADPDVYGIPMLVLIGWRGRPGVRDEPQHVKQGRVMARLLDAIDLPWRVLPKQLAAAEQCVRAAVTTATRRSCPVILLVEKETFVPVPTTAPATAPTTVPALDRPSREEALAALVDAVGEGPVIVATTGMLGRELFEHRVRTGADGARDFLTVGGMGHASSIALGIAMSEPEREVWCCDGDGALLMHLGSLAVIAGHAPASFFHVVFNNGVHDSVGGQPTAIDQVDVVAAARALGYRYATATAEPAQLAAAVAQLRAHSGPSLLEIRVRPGHRPELGRPTRSPHQSKQAFMSAL